MNMNRTLGIVKAFISVVFLVSGFIGLMAEKYRESDSFAHAACCPAGFVDPAAARALL